MPKRFSVLSFVLLILGLIAIPLAFAGSQDILLKLNSGNYVQKAENFLILFDKSGSMNDLDGELSKFEQEKVLVNEFNNMVPDLKLNAGLREFGENKSDSQLTKLDYGMSAYNRGALAKVIAGLTYPMGRTPLTDALEAAGKDLQGTQGKIALIVFSDGLEVGETAVTAATAVKQQYGDRICIYTVQLGTNLEGGKLLDSIARAGQCGAYFKGERLRSDAAMTAFVETIFLAVKPPAAVPPPPPPPPPRKVTIDMDVKFDFDKYAIKSEYRDEIKKVADFMNQYPDTTATIEGYTDSIGKKAYNMKLSKQRAGAIVDYLVSKFKIDKSRLKTVGYGEQKPVDSNETAAGRQQNRRAVAHLETIVR